MSDNATPAGVGSSAGLGLVERLRAEIERTVSLDLLHQEASDEIEQWRKLRDPLILHVSLLRGQPARLSRAALLHLAGADQLLDALRDVLDFQSASSGPTIHQWGRWRRLVDEFDRTSDVDNTDDADEEDPADIIAGALQTSRAHAFELMERAVAKRFA